MPTNILMPALSPTMEKGNLARWLKKEGDTVKSGDVIAEIETDKATMEVEAVDEGTLARIVVPEGAQDVAVNSVIAVLAGEGEDVKAAASTKVDAPKKEETKKAEQPKAEQAKEAKEPAKDDSAKKAPEAKPASDAKPAAEAKPADAGAAPQLRDTAEPGAVAAALQMRRNGLNKD